eukprot:CAMPEP_0184498436 /NCGR_PEP_ID=MMETSP0113_2-20130426/38993_1 /TAXON_ID=91329 /ORGANISM="Norrisiella sphaerica, Strain BC52" /LENGTH=389 /DNA_ID=CAMNT_0026885943 /DNA_START=21 /DNA_END=1187 /DNA_ORIENTATION=-
MNASPNSNPPNASTEPSSASTNVNSARDDEPRPQTGASVTGNAGFFLTQTEREIDEGEQKEGSDTEANAATNEEENKGVHTDRNGTTETDTSPETKNASKQQKQELSVTTMEGKRSLKEKVSHLRVSMGPEKGRPVGSKEKEGKPHSMDRPLSQFTAHERDVWSIHMLTAPQSVHSEQYEVKDLQFVTAGQDGTARIYRGDGECLAILPDHEGPVFCVQPSPDGKIIATAGYDNTIRLWLMVKGPIGKFEELTRDQRRRRKMLEDQGYWECLRILEGHANVVNMISWNSSGTMIASAANDNSVRIWTLDGKCKMELKGHSDDVRCCKFSPCDKYVISGSWDRTVKIWRVLGGSCTNTFIGHRNYVWGLDVSSDGEYIASCSWDETCRIW